MDARDIAEGLNFCDSFTLRRIVGRRWPLRIMRFEMTSSEKASADKLVDLGCAAKALVGYCLTPLGLAVRQHLEVKP